MNSGDAKRILSVIGFGDACCSACAEGKPCGETTGLSEEGYATSREEVGMTPGDYHIVGSGVTLRALPDASSASLATLQNGETVYVFGEIQTDPAHIVGPNNIAIPNPDPEQYAGIDYVRVGTQTHGAGWVSNEFIQPGSSGVVAVKPRPEPKLDYVPTNLPKPAAASWVPWVFASAVVVVLAGGAIYLARRPPLKLRTA